MALECGNRLGIYVIESELGSGGMGEVYRARDDRLNRTVAIKLLHPAQAGDAERRARFLREARTASALNHPNIITIYDIGCEDGRDYLVMEYLSGKPLNELIPHGGLQSTVALNYALQIASAMSAAHSTGIVHRDLKPANVMVCESGLVKVLDFGLAKTLAPRGDEVTTLDQARSSDTENGRIVGTAAYMSPEQAAGGKVDARSDIFAFGCMFYEMLTGISPFKRNSVMLSLSAVLRDQPKPLHEVNGNLPSEAEKIIRRCLQKEPDRRFQSSADLRVVLQELKEESESGALAVQAKPDVSPNPWLKRALWGSAVGMLLIAAALILYQRGHSVAPVLPPTESLLISPPGFLGAPSLSPDGNQVAFSWDGGTGGPTQIYLKVVGPGEPLRLTNGAEYTDSPVWSPDGTSIAFLTLTGDNLGVISDTSRLFAVNTLVRLVVISALGGTPRELFSYEGTIHRFSWSLDGKFIIVPSQTSVYAVSVESKERRKILDPPPNHVYRSSILSPDGRTLALTDSVSGQPLGAIYLQTMGSDGTPLGTPRSLPVTQAAVTSLAWTADSKALIFGGTMLLTTSSLWRISVDGGRETRLGNIGEGGNLPTIAGPSGRHSGRMVYQHVFDDSDIWKLSHDKGIQGSSAPLIASTKRELEPRYSPDGRKIAFTSNRGGLADVWVANADGSELANLTDFKGGGTAGVRWSPDGKQIVFLSKKEGQSEIYTLDVQGGTPVRVTNNPAHDTAPAWSPDGKWIYFASDRGGRFEIWKAPPDGKGEAVQVTRNGGYAAVFAPDGNAMFYTKLNPAEGIWKQTLVSGEPSGEESHILPIHLSNWGNFDVNRDGIAYVPIEPAPAHIYFYRFATGSATRVGEFSGAPDFGISISPVDGSILFSQVNKPRRELVLVENFR